MPVLSIRVPEKIMHEIDANARILHITKNAYISKAITSLNQKINDELRIKRLTEASHKVRKSSMKINLELSSIEDDVKI